MTFDDFAAQFGVKSGFVRSIPTGERAAFRRASTRLHDKGFDWYIGDDDLCFGIRPHDSQRAALRGGRLRKSLVMTMNLGHRQLKAMRTGLIGRLRELGVAEAAGLPRFRFTISQFDELVSDSEFLNEFAILCGVAGPPGVWPGLEQESLAALPEVTSIQQIFRNSYERLAVVKSLKWNRRSVEEGFIRHDSRLSQEPDLVALHFIGRVRREIWVGSYRGMEPVANGGKGFELHVDRFRRLGEHFTGRIDEVTFYGDKASEGSIVYVKNKGILKPNGREVPPETVGMALVQIRKGQQDFKRILKNYWGVKCAVSGCREEKVLEAAHVIPFSNSLDHQPSNGLMLRADLHALFDAHLLSVDAKGLVHIAKSIKDPAYSIFRGKPLTKKKELWPDGLAESLEVHHKEYLKCERRQKS